MWTTSGIVFRVVFGLFLIVLGVCLLFSEGFSVPALAGCCWGWCLLMGAIDDIVDVSAIQRPPDPSDSVKNTPYPNPPPPITPVQPPRPIEDGTFKSHAAIVQLAMHIGSVRGAMGSREITVIQEWGRKTVNALPNCDQASCQRALNDALEIAWIEISGMRSSALATRAVHALNQAGNPLLIEEGYELCLRVVAADEKLHPKEMEHLQKIAKQLNYDQNRLRTLLDRYLARMKIELGTDESDRLLGIDPSMSKHEIKRHLNRLFAKWEGRTQHNNPTVKEEAKKWLDLIAKARVRHLNGS